MDGWNGGEEITKHLCTKRDRLSFIFSQSSVLPSSLLHKRNWRREKWQQHRQVLEGQEGRQAGSGRK